MIKSLSADLELIEAFLRLSNEYNRGTYLLWQLTQCNKLSAI
jgi:hypothetical protein